MTDETKSLQELLYEPGAPMVNWVQILHAIDDEFKTAKNSEHRGALLQTFKTTMDVVEENLDIDQEKMDNLKKIRREHYKRLLLEEVMVGETVAIQTLFETTGREIEEARLDPEDNIRKLAVEGVTGHYGTHPKIIMTGGSIENLRFEEKPKIEPTTSLLGTLGRLFGK